MSQCDSTSWNLIRDAANGAADRREEFANRYSPVLRSYFLARWKTSTLIQDADDATQECFVDCFRDNGVLSRVDEYRPGGFRAYLYGVARTTAGRFERRQGQSRERQFPAVDDLDRTSDPGLSEAFDRAWAQSIMREAVERLERRAEQAGPRVRKRLELLRRRFVDGMSIREIAELWVKDPAHLHHEYATARAEFKESLLNVVSLHHRGTPAEIERECIELLELLQ